MVHGVRPFNWVEIGALRALLRQVRAMASGGVYIGSTPSDPGVNNLSVEGTITASSQVKGPHLIRIPAASMAAAIDHTNTSGAAETWTSGDLRGATGIAAAALGVVGRFQIAGGTGAAGTMAQVFSADDSQVEGHQLVEVQVATFNADTTVVVTLGTGANAGKLKVYSSVNNLRTFFYPTHYWQ